jgi:flavin reductase (DIM6/NTAB) family NADH-FMN oxidoreductase RutF
VDADEFDPFVAALDYPMFVLTMSNESRSHRAGCLVGFASQCSISPAKFLVCLSKKNHTFRASAAARQVGLHLLAQSGTGLAALFGTETGDEIDKFEHCAWVDGPYGVPVLEACAAWLVAEVESRVDLGDHEGLVLAPLVVGAGPVERPLMFSAVQHLKAGHDA